MAIDPLVFKIDGDAVGAVKAIEEVTKKVDGLRSKEAGLQAALSGVNTTTEEGKRVFAQLKAELDVVENKMLKFNAASDGLKNISKDLNDRVGKFSGIVSSLGQVAGTSGGKIAEMANAGASLAQAFAMGGGMAAGIAAVTIALGKLNDGLSTYIDRAAAAETARIASEAAAISAGSAVGRGAAADLAALNPLTIEQQQRKKLAETEAAIAAQRAKMASRPGSALAIGALQPGEQLTRKQDEQALETLLRLQASLNSHLAEAARLSAEAAASKEKQAAATEKAAQAEAAALRLSKARAGLAAANTASAVEAENRALDLNNPDPGAGLFGSQTPVATTEQIKAMNELFMMAPTMEFSEGIIDGAIAVEDLAQAARKASDDLGAVVPSSLVSAVAGGASGLGSLGGMIGGAGGPIGSAVGSVVGSIAGAGLDQVIAKVGVFNGVLESAANVFAQVEPIWQTTAEAGQTIGVALQYASAALRPVTTLLSLLSSPFGALYDVVGDLMADGLIPFAIVMSKMTNAVIDFINTIAKFMNEHLGTDFDMLSYVLTADLIGSVEDAGEAIRENLTDEFVNLPPGFKTGGAVFAATDVGGAGGGSGGLTIGTVNVSTTRTLLDELKSLQDRAGIGSSSIIGGRNSISDRRN